MLIKIISHTASEPQRPGELTRLLRYIIAGHSGTGGADVFKRLAGPIFTRRIVQRVNPYEEDFRLAVSDVAAQFYDLIRKGCFDRDLPRQVYSHVIISFAPAFRRRVARMNSALTKSKPIESTYSRALWIVLDTIAELGISQKMPLFLAVHDDKRHLHAHVVVALYAKETLDCDIHKTNRAKILSIANKMDRVHGVGRISQALQRKHESVSNPFLELHS